MQDTVSLKKKDLKNIGIVLSLHSEVIFKRPQMPQSSSLLGFKTDLNAKLLYLDCKAILKSAERDKQIMFSYTIFVRNALISEGFFTLTSGSKIPTQWKPKT